MALTAKEQAELDHLESLGPAPRAAKGLSKEEQAELDHLESLGPPPQMHLSYDPMHPKETSKQYVPPETSIPSQAATMIFKGAQTTFPIVDDVMGAFNAGNKAFGETLGYLPDEGKPLMQDFKEERQKAREVMAGLNAANPNSATAGTVLGVAGALRAKALEGVSGIAHAFGYGVAESESDSDLDKLRQGAKYAAGLKAMQVIGGPMLQSFSNSGIKDTVPALTAAEGAAMNNLEKLGKRHGIPEWDLQEQLQQVQSGTANAARNDLEAIRVMSDKGILKGNPKAGEMVKRLKEVRSVNGEEVMGQLKKADAVAPVEPGSMFDENAVKARLQEKFGDEQGLEVFDDAMRNFGKDINSNMSRVNAQAAKQRIYDRVSQQKFDPNPHSPLNLRAEGAKEVAFELKDNIERATPGANIKKLNNEMAASFNYQELAKKGYNKKILGGNPLVRAAKGFMGSKGLDRPVGFMQGLSNNMDLQTNPQPLPQPPTLMERSTQSIHDFINQSGTMLPPAVLPLLEKFKNATPDQQEQMGPILMQEAERSGIKVPVSSTGYNSEFNGKITDLAERNQAALAVSKLQETGKMSLIDAAKQISALNQDGSIPQSLVKNVPPPAMSAPVEQAAPAPQALPQDLMKAFT